MAPFPSHVVLHGMIMPASMQVNRLHVSIYYFWSSFLCLLRHISLLLRFFFTFILNLSLLNRSRESSGIRLLLFPITLHRKSSLENICRSGDQRNTCGSHLSFTIVWVPGIEFRLTDSVANAFTHWCISLALTSVSQAGTEHFLQHHLLHLRQCRMWSNTEMSEKEGKQKM